MHKLCKNYAFYGDRVGMAPGWAGCPPLNDLLATFLGARGFQPPARNALKARFKEIWEGQASNKNKLKREFVERRLRNPRDPWFSQRLEVLRRNQQEEKRLEVTYGRLEILIGVSSAAQAKKERWYDTFEDPVKGTIYLYEENSMSRIKRNDEIEQSGGEVERGVEAGAAWSRMAEQWGKMAGYPVMFCKNLSSGPRAPGPELLNKQKLKCVFRYLELRRVT